MSIWALRRSYWRKLRLGDASRGRIQFGNSIEKGERMTPWVRYVSTLLLGLGVTLSCKNSEECERSRMEDCSHLEPRERWSQSPQNKR